jgi:hypothetical protein
VLILVLHLDRPEEPRNAIAAAGAARGLAKGPHVDCLRLLLHLHQKPHCSHFNQPVLLLLLPCSRVCLR